MATLLNNIRIAPSTYIKDRFTHLVILGKTGTGKTSLMENILWQDSFFPYTKILVEPSGFLAKDAYSILRGKAKYCSLSNPISLNPLVLPLNPNQISETVAEATNHLVMMTTQNKELTVKMRAILDEAVKWCLGNNRKSLEFVLDYILNKKGDNETRDGLIQRLRFLLNDERTNQIICGSKPTDFQKLIDNKQSLVLDCEGMGKEKMIFLGFLVAQYLVNYMRYGKAKQPCVFYVDECHNFINYNFLSLLKEARKYQLSCIMGTQDLAVFTPKFARILLNIGNIICFRSGNIEAKLIASETRMKAEDIQFLDKYHFAYLTENKTGIAKAILPPVVKPFQIKPKAERKKKSKGWFPLVFC